MKEKSEERLFGHEIRTLMNSVLGMIDLAVDRIEDSEAREYLSTASQAGKTAMRKINDYLHEGKSVIDNPALYPPADPSPASGKSVLPGNVKPLVGIKPLRILVAEDNPINQKIVHKFLSKYDHNVVVVGNGREALAELENKNFDLIIMDVEMPEMDGREAVRLIREREDETGMRIPIIALTASAAESGASWMHCLDAYVPKPFSPTRLYEVISELVEK